MVLWKGRFHTPPLNETPVKRRDTFSVTLHDISTYCDWKDTTRFVSGPWIAIALRRISKSHPVVSIAQKY